MISPPDGEIEEGGYIPARWVTRLMSEDNILIARARQGDEASINTLITRYWQPVYRLACLKTGNIDDAQELTQETFFKALRALPGYKDTGASFKTYLGRIAINLITDYWRKKGRTPQIVDIATYQEPLVDRDELPEEQTLSKEMRERIGTLLGLLPPEQRQTVELRILAGLSVQETSRLIGKSEAAVKMLQQRGLKNLRRLFEEHGIVG